MRKDIRSDCEITLCENEYEILHELRETVMNSSELLEALHGETPYDLNVIALDLERMIDGYVERIFENEKEWRPLYLHRYESHICKMFVVF